MIRHIFIGTFKEGISDEQKQRVLSDMMAMKDNIPGIAALKVGFSTGWMGQKNQIIVTSDVATKDDFDAYINHPYHRDDISQIAGELMEQSSFVMAQFEF